MKNWVGSGSMCFLSPSNLDYGCMLDLHDLCALPQMQPEPSWSSSTWP